MKVYCYNCKFSYKNKVIYTIENRADIFCSRPELNNDLDNFYYHQKVDSLCWENNKNNDCKYHEKKEYFCLECGKKREIYDSVLCDDCFKKMKEKSNNFLKKIFSW